MSSHEPLAARALERATCPRQTLTVAAVSLLSVLGWIVVGMELHRVAEGRLFLFSLSGDRPATPPEVADAHLLATGQRFQAMVVVPLLIIAALGSVRKLRKQGWPIEKIWWWGAALFLVAAIADGVTTLWFFHRLGVDHELHPGIRLFGYAYGRTIGPILGKGLQAIGILLLAAWRPRYGTALLLLAAVVCLAAAGYNLCRTLASPQAD
ncbi:hypothetical protein [Planctomicrobium sp. SH664]|uniref:hypothetical protein n=1 Tax=Planctomicrobium sp. SH664 TaxID=3448125 RepID=UPI003F5CA0AE